MSGYSLTGILLDNFVPGLQSP